MHSPTAAGHTLRDLRDHGPALFSAAAVLHLPLLLFALGGALLEGPAQTATRLTFGIVGLFTAYVWLPVSLIRAARRHAHGESLGMVEILEEGARGTRLISFAAAFVLIWIILAGALLAVLAIPGVAIAFYVLGTGGHFSEITLGGLGVVAVLVLMATVAALMIVMFLLAVRYSLVPAIAALEVTGPMRSLRRAVDMVRGRFFDALLMLLMIMASGFVVGIALGLPASMVQLSDAVGGGIPAAGVRVWAPAREGAAGVIVALSTYLVRVAYTPFWTGLIGNFYLSVRGEEALATSLTSPPGDLTGTGRESDADQQQYPSGPDGQAGNLPEDNRGDEG